MGSLDARTVRLKHLATAVRPGTRLCLLAGLERFREVRLDFTRVEGVGQGFVDEIFRAWSKAHPTVRLVPLAMNEPVEFMIRRGRPAGRQA